MYKVTRNKYLLFCLFVNLSYAITDDKNQLLFQPEPDAEIVDAAKAEINRFLRLYGTDTTGKVDIQKGCRFYEVYDTSHLKTQYINNIDDLIAISVDRPTWIFPVFVNSKFNGILFVRYVKKENGYKWDATKYEERNKFYDRLLGICKKWPLKYHIRIFVYNRHLCFYNVLEEGNNNFTPIESDIEYINKTSFNKKYMTKSNEIAELQQTIQWIRENKF